MIFDHRDSPIIGMKKMNELVDLHDVQRRKVEEAVMEYHPQATVGILALCELPSWWREQWCRVSVGVPEVVKLNWPIFNRIDGEKIANILVGSFHSTI